MSRAVAEGSGVAECCLARVFESGSDRANSYFVLVRYPESSSGWRVFEIFSSPVVVRRGSVCTLREPQDDMCVASYWKWWDSQRSFTAPAQVPPLWSGRV